MKILFLIPYPTGVAPSQRYRFEQYLPLLRERDVSCDIAPFLDLKTWSIIYKPGFFLQKLWGISIGLLRRTVQLFKLNSYDFIFIHREAAPVGPPVFEFLIAKVFKKKIIYDFDDAIWLPNSSISNRFFSIFKTHASTEIICRWAHKISCGSEFLYNFAQHYNHSVVYNPTTVDTIRLHNRIKSFSSNSIITLGWTGSHSTISYLEELVPVLMELESECHVKLLVISDIKPDFALKSMTYKPWSKDTEIEDLLEIDIGLMPLSDDPWAAGKCGLKALQYMALGIPAIVSNVGVNERIVDHEVNGFICRNAGDWKKYITMLVSDRNLLKKLGAATREKVEMYYSVTSNSENFLNLFR